MVIQANAHDVTLRFKVGRKENRGRNRSRVVNALSIQGLIAKIEVEILALERPFSERNLGATPHRPPSLSLRPCVIRRVASSVEMVPGLDAAIGQTAGRVQQPS